VSFSDTVVVHERAAHAQVVLVCGCLCWCSAQDDSWVDRSCQHAQPAAGAQQTVLSRCSARAAAWPASAIHQLVPEAAEQFEQCTALTWASSRQSGCMRLAHSGKSFTTEVAGPTCGMRPPPQLMGGRWPHCRYRRELFPRHAAARMELHDCLAVHVSGSRCSMLAAHLGAGRCYQECQS
jgi:hypothetical protein